MIWSWLKNRKKLKAPQARAEEHYAASGSGSLAMASSMCIGPERQRIRYMRRMTPRFKQESGWIVYSGEESAEFANNLRNFQQINLASVISDDPSVEVVLESPVGAEWTRKLPDDIWRRIVEGNVVDETGKVIGHCNE